MTSKLDRARGTLIGLAAGDAVGTALEFRDPGTFTAIDDMVGGGPFRLKPGQWTDDTSMALCLAESLVDRRENDLADQLRRYVMWWKGGYLSSTGRCFDIGSATQEQLSRFVRTGEPVDPHPDEDRCANGSLMRLGSVPIRWHTDIEAAIEHAAHSSRSTHAAARPVDACRVLGAMTAALIQGADPASVFDPSFWEWGALHPTIEAVARGSWATKQPPAIRGTGYCVDALEAAIWAVAGADDFRSAVLSAANLGDDADTTAAIAGQLAGARWGVSGIPAHWRDQLTMSERFVSLADALASHATPGIGAPWGFDALVHGWWVEPGVLLAGEYPGHPSRSRAELKLAVLVDAGVRTFVDLTTPDDHLEPYQSLVDQIAEQRQLDLQRVSFPIPDLHVRDDAFYDEVLAFLATQRAAGRPVYVHCWGGVGRTGTVIGCRLIESGMTSAQALDHLRELRANTGKAERKCPETRVQLDFLHKRSRTGDTRR